MAWPGLGQAGTQERRDRVVGAGDDRETGGQAQLRSGPGPQPGDHGAGPGRRRGDPLVEPCRPGLRRGDRFGRVLERRRCHAGQAEGHVVPRGEEPGSALDGLRMQRPQQARPPEQADHPALATDCRGGGGRLVAGPPVQPGDRRRQGVAVGGGRHERGTLADHAERDGLRRPVDGCLGAGDPDPADERRPPVIGPLLGPAGCAVDEERVRDAGEATETAVGREHARLHGRGAEIDGDEDARIGGHGHEW